MKSTSDFDTIIGAFEKIESIRGRNEKMAVLADLASNSSTNVMTREILTYLLNPYWTYGVRFSPNPWATTKSLIKDDTYSAMYWPTFQAVLDALRAREFTGNDAREAVVTVLGSMSPRYASFLCNVLNRDLKCGLQWSSFDTSFPYLVATISPQLCTKLDLSGELEGEYYCEPKLDGTRLHIVIHNDGTMLALSRNGRPSHNCDHIFEAIAGIRLPDDKGYVIDAEEYSGSWSKTVQLKATKNKIVAKKVIHCFDILTIEEWEKQECKRPLSERKAHLDAWYERILSYNLSVKKYIKLTPCPVVHSMPQVLKLTNKYTDKELEGSVVKRVDRFYDFGRTDAWQKVKPTDEDTFTVVGYKKGTGRNANRCGAIQIEGKLRGMRILSWMGQGLSDANRTKITNMHRKKVLLGSKIDIEFQGTTDQVMGKKNTDNTYAVRNGVFKRFRPDLE